MTNIFVSGELKEKISELNLSCIECDVVVRETDNELWKIIENKISELAASLKVEEISQIPVIAASRKAYKTCGKDPARYRLSAEALLRRVIHRNELYQVNNVVDLLNLVSISTGFSIGGYDANKVNGEIIFGIGTSGEEYYGIGRGELNIEGMPVFRDKMGAFGTPTSDSVRTSVSLDTKRFLMVIVNFGRGALQQATDYAVLLLKKYANAENIEIKTVTE